MSTTTRKCTNPECGEWYDARSVSCYVCNMEEREVNRALQKAVETTMMNSHLARQAGGLGAERQAESELRAAAQDKTGQSYARVRPRVPGYGDMVQGIKDSLEEHPEVLDYFGGE